jgi:hypothetical protein
MPFTPFLFTQLCAPSFLASTLAAREFGACGVDLFFVPVLSLIFRHLALVVP